MNNSPFGRKAPRQFGLSDDQSDRELKARARLKRAISDMQLAIDDVNTSSALVKIRPAALDDLIHDELPDFEDWAELINEGRY